MYECYWAEKVWKDDRTVAHRQVCHTEQEANDWVNEDKTQEAALMATQGDSEELYDYHIYHVKQLS